MVCLRGAQDTCNLEFQLPRQGIRRMKVKSGNQSSIDIKNKRFKFKE